MKVRRVQVHDRAEWLGLAAAHAPVLLGGPPHSSLLLLLLPPLPLLPQLQGVGATPLLPCRLLPPTGQGGDSGQRGTGQVGESVQGEGTGQGAAQGRGIPAAWDPLPIPCGRSGFGGLLLLQKRGGTERCLSAPPNPAEATPPWASPPKCWLLAPQPL